MITNLITAYHLAPSPAGRAAGPTLDDDSSTGGEIVQKGIEVQVNAFTGGRLRLDVIVTNHAMVETDITLSLDLAADFADLTKAQISAPCRVGRCPFRRAAAAAARRQAARAAAAPA